MAPVKRWGFMVDPFSMQDRMSKILGEALAGWRGRQSTADSVCEPPVDIYEKEDSFILKADLPGVALEDIEVEVKDETLHIKGRKSHKEGQEPATGLFIMQERNFGEFYRVFSLPGDIEQEKVGAKLKNGVLTVVIPKKEAGRAKQITVDVQ
jgi:HSP20 family protein